jgi:hypothetical protein
MNLSYSSISRINSSEDVFQKKSKKAYLGIATNWLVEVTLELRKQHLKFCNLVSFGPLYSKMRLIFVLSVIGAKGWGT